MKNIKVFLLALALVYAGSACAKERTYYIAAEEINWDYAPKNKDLMMGHVFNEQQKVFVENSNKSIGKEYKKAAYIEYTDSSFTQKKLRSPAEVHLGILGPTLRAEVGDTLHIVFKNLASRPYSMHPHGVFYLKAHEGAMTNDATSAADKKGDSVRPGNIFEYEWVVNERAGPGKNDPSSIVWLYHSHVNSVRDSNTGLIGAIVVSKKGMAKKDGFPKDVDVEFVNLFSVMNENESWYLEDNIKTFTDPRQVDMESDEFIESNLMHMINGYVFGNIPGLDMKKGDRVRWHLIALGSEVDLHTPHWHGNTGLINGHRTDVVELMPASMKTLDMLVDNVGTWMYHCHVNDHIKAGMTALYHVTDRDN